MADASLSDSEFLRYGRQLLLEEIGEAGQARLKQARVLLVGLGGLGSPASLYLAAAGVGQLWLADGDRLEVSNLQRQVLYRSDQLGQEKQRLAVKQLTALNPHVRCHPLERLDEATLATLLPDLDLVLDCSDNMQTRQAVNRACVRQEVPLISAAASGWQGQLLVMEPQRRQGCYHCLFPTLDEPAQNCRSVGILGPVVGMLGILQALEAVKLLCDVPGRQTGRLWRWDARTLGWKSLPLSRDPACSVCSGEPPHLSGERP